MLSKRYEFLSLTCYKEKKNFLFYFTIEES